jgi:toxin CcdB
VARFEVFAAGPNDHGYWLDCQSDLLSHLSHRLIVPLIPRDLAPLPIAGLNPIFTIEGSEVVMMTHFAAAVPARELKRRIISLGHEHGRIMRAIDMLVTDT